MLIFGTENAVLPWVMINIVIFWFFYLMNFRKCF